MIESHRLLMTYIGILVNINIQLSSGVLEPDRQLTLRVVDANEASLRCASVRLEKIGAMHDSMLLGYRLKNELPYKN
jgi:hypothetical protein